uniref:Uncharacterized protein n=1 Tax=Onchocerca volvulus TaxID=6282 RepID=A0A8R1TL12_ONCVO
MSPMFDSEHGLAAMQEYSLEWCPRERFFCCILNHSKTPHQAEAFGVRDRHEKAQLCSLNLETDCLSHGQLYVACSEVGIPDNLYIYTDNGTTKNIVYPQRHHQNDPTDRKTTKIDSATATVRSSEGPSSRQFKATQQ